VRKISRRLFLATLLAAVAWSALPGAQAQPAARPLRLLFIGNSYTYVNNLPEMFSKLAEAGRHPVETVMVAPGGWRLQDHWEKGEAPKVLRGGKWDYVVLQEQSTLATNFLLDGKPRVKNDEAFRPWAEKWSAEIGKTGARPVFYLTWARKATPEDQSVLTDAYMRAAKSNQALVAPVGIAWSQVRQQNPSIELFFTDGSHPSPAGTYLAACTFYAAIFHASPVGLPAKITGHPVTLASGLVSSDTTAVLVDLAPADAQALQAAAWAAWQQIK
jgi:hypothetical protein